MEIDSGHHLRFITFLSITEKGGHRWESETVHFGIMFIDNRAEKLHDIGFLSCPDRICDLKGALRYSLG